VLTDFGILLNVEVLKTQFSLHVFTKETEEKHKNFEIFRVAAEFKSENLPNTSQYFGTTDCFHLWDRRF
jgi:hypothetical protein